METDSGRTTSIWMDTVQTHEPDRLQRDRKVEVCVVGAGIAGITAAYLLARAGKQVIVLDDGPVGGGETGRTTAHLTNAMDDRFYHLERMHGEEGSRLTAASHGAAINRIEAITSMEKIDCDFTRLDGYLFLDAEHDSDDVLARELDAAHRAGLADVERLTRAPLDFWDTGPCLRFPNQAQFHPLKYLFGLVGAIERDGGKIYGHTHVESIEGEGPITVKTATGRTVSAEHVVVATNSPISDYVVTHVKQAPYRTFVVGARVRTHEVPTALLWDIGDPYHYVRLQPLNGRDSLLIVGGEDHKTGQEDDADERFARLESWTRKRFPMARDFTHRWSGQVLEPADGLGLIGRNPRTEAEVYIATGDSGQGMTHGTIAGILLTDMILGRENAWAKLYDPSRITLSSARELARENINVAVQYADWIKPAEAKSVDEIAPGTGAVLRRGKHRVAAFRDDDGTIHERSAKCTHLGCVVHWNSTEGSWDCPCHGSRFDPRGNVLNGPALSALEPPAEE